MYSNTYLMNNDEGNLKYDYKHKNGVPRGLIFFIHFWIYIYFFQSKASSIQ